MTALTAIQRVIQSFIEWPQPDKFCHKMTGFFLVKTIFYKKKFTIEII